MGNTLLGFTCCLFCVLLFLFGVNLAQDICPQPQERIRTDLVVHGLAEGAEATYTCQSPYVFPDGDASKSIICQSSGVWTSLTGLTDVCLGTEWKQTKQHECSQSTQYQSSPYYQSYSQAILASQEQVYFCIDKCKGYNPPCAAFTIRVTPEKCYFYKQCVNINLDVSLTLYEGPVECTSQAETLDNANLTVVGEPPHSATYTCHTGYAFADGEASKTISCQSDGSWTVMADICLIDCMQPGTLNNTDMTVSETLEDSTATYTCQSGYAFIDGDTSKSISCQSDGNWTAMTDDCKIDCMDPAPVEYAILDKPNTLVGATATYTCQSGYAFRDREASKSISCQSDGNWETMTDDCLKVIKQKVFTRASIELEELFVDAYKDLNTLNGLRLKRRIEQELDQLFRATLEDFHSTEVVRLRDNDGRTVVNIQVATLSDPFYLDEDALVDNVKELVGAAISDDYVGGYKVYSKQSPALVVPEATKENIISSATIVLVKPDTLSEVSSEWEEQLKNDIQPELLQSVQSLSGFDDLKVTGVKVKDDKIFVDVDVRLLPNTATDPAAMTDTTRTALQSALEDGTVAQYGVSTESGALTVNEPEELYVSPTRIGFDLPWKDEYLYNDNEYTIGLIENMEGEISNILNEHLDHFKDADVVELRLEDGRVVVELDVGVLGQNVQELNVAMEIVVASARILGIDIIQESIRVNLPEAGPLLTSVSVPLLDTYDPDPASDELQQYLDATKQQLQDALDIYDTYGNLQVENVFLKQEAGKPVVDITFSSPAVGLFIYRDLMELREDFLDVATGSGYLAGKQIDSTKENTVATPGKVAAVTHVSFEVDRTYQDAYNSPSSDEASELSTLIEEELDKRLNIVDGYKYVTIQPYSDKNGNVGVDIDIETESVLGWFDRIELKKAIEKALNIATKYGNLGGYKATRADDQSLSVNKPSSGDSPPKETLYMRASIELLKPYTNELKNLSSVNAQEIAKPIEDELDHIFKATLKDYQFSNVVLLRDKDGHTVVDVQVAALSTPDKLDRKAIENALENSFGAAISDGKVGGYPVYSDQLPTMGVSDINIFNVAPTSVLLDWPWRDEYSNNDNEDTTKLFQDIEKEAEKILAEHYVDFNAATVTALSERNGQTMAQLDIDAWVALNMEDKAFQEATIDAMQIFVALAHIGGVHVKTVDVQDPQYDPFSTISFPLTETYNTAFDSPKSEESKQRVDAVKTEIKDIFDAAGSAFQVDNVKLKNVNGNTVVDVAVSSPADGTLSGTQLQEALQDSVNEVQADGKLAEVSISTSDTVISVTEKVNAVTTVPMELDEAWDDDVYSDMNSEGTRKLITHIEEHLSDLLEEVDGFQSVTVEEMHDVYGNTGVVVDIVAETELGSFDAKALKEAIKKALRQATDVGSLGGFVVAQKNEDCLSVAKSSLGASPQTSVFSLPSIILEDPFVDEYRDLSTPEAEWMMSWIEDELNEIFDATIKGHQYSDVMVLREKDGRTVVDVQIAALSTPESFDEEAFEDEVTQAVGAAISDGYVGGYKVYTHDPPVLTVQDIEEVAEQVITPVFIVLDEEYNEDTMSDITSPEAQQLINDVITELEDSLDGISGFNDVTVIGIRQEDGRRVLVIDVRTAVDASTDKDAISEEVELALQAALSDTDLGGHVVYTMPDALTVDEPEDVFSADASVHIDQAWNPLYLDMTDAQTIELLEDLGKEVNKILDEYIDDFKDAEIMAFRDEDGQTVMDINVDALGDDDAEMVQDNIKIAWKIFVANAKLGGVDVGAATVDDPELELIRHVPFTLAESYSTSYDNPTSVEATDHVDDVTVELQGIFDDEPGNFHVKAVTLREEDGRTVVDVAVSNPADDPVNDLPATLQNIIEQEVTTTGFLAGRPLYSTADTIVGSATNGDVETHISLELDEPNNQVLSDLNGEQVQALTRALEDQLEERLKNLDGFKSIDWILLSDNDGTVVVDVNITTEAGKHFEPAALKREIEIILQNVVEEGNLGGSPAVSSGYDSISVDTPSLGDSPKAYVVTGSQVKLEMMYNDTFGNPNSTEAKQILADIRDELSRIFKESVPNFKFVDLELLRGIDNKTEVLIDVASLTQYDQFDEDAIQDAFELGLSVALSDGFLGGYRIDTGEEESVIVAEPREEQIITPVSVVLHVDYNGLSSNELEQLIEDVKAELDTTFTDASIGFEDIDVSVRRKEDNGKIAVDVKVGTSADESSDTAAIKQAIQNAFQSHLAGNGETLAGHTVLTGTVTEPEQGTYLVPVTVCLKEPWIDDYNNTNHPFIQILKQAIEAEASNELFEDLGDVTEAHYVSISEKNGTVVAEVELGILAPLDATDQEELKNKIQKMIDRLIADGSLGGVDTKEASVDVDNPAIGTVQTQGTIPTNAQLDDLDGTDAQQVKDDLKIELKEKLLAAGSDFKVKNIELRNENGKTVADIVFKASGQMDVSAKEMHEKLLDALPDITVDNFDVSAVTDTSVELPHFLSLPEFADPDSKEAEDVKAIIQKYVQDGLEEDNINESQLGTISLRDEDGHTLVGMSFITEAGAVFDAWEEQFKLKEMLLKVFSANTLGGYMLDFDVHAMSINMPRLNSNECSSNPCQHGGTCLEDISKFLCHCADAFRGKLCEIVPACTIPEDMEFANKTYESTQYEALTTYTCEPGYSINPAQPTNNTFTSTCLGNATWSQTTVCQQITCSEPDVVVRAQFNYSSTLYGATANYTCVAGYGVPPNNFFTSTCLSSGLWSQTPVCQIMNECASNPCRNAAQCADSFNQFNCVCLSGYTGKLCETSTRGRKLAGDAGVIPDGTATPAPITETKAQHNNQYSFPSMLDPAVNIPIWCFCCGVSVACWVAACVWRYQLKIEERIYRERMEQQKFQGKTIS